MPHQRKLSTFVIFVEAFLILATFFPTYLYQLFSTTTMMLASDGHKKQLPRLHTTLSFGKTQFGNGGRIKPSMFNTSLAKSIRLIFFSKEMSDGAHFRCLWDSFMSRLSNFINDSLLGIHHTNQQSPKQFIPSAAKAMSTVHPSSYFSALVSSSFCCTFTASSHLCSAGRQLLWNFQGYVPPHLL
jgi:hypothetical protein